MLEPKFNHYDLKLVEPDFGSPLTDLIIDLNFLRRKQLTGSTHPSVFFQLKGIFHTLESIGSARIEGNNTTIAEYIETKIEASSIVPPSIQEIRNIEDAMSYIEEHIDKITINRAFISDLHKMIVQGLPLPPTGEGDHTPGIYRKINLKINKSTHLPPDFVKVPDYMDELFSFIDEQHAPKYDLLKIALAHHRFVWVHPFGNGNGRTVRLFTYAMLVKLGFNVGIGRILNPTAVFCSNRDDYYNYLAEADTGSDEGILNWTEYVLNGLKEEIEKIDRLLDYGHLKTEVLLPALSYSVEREYITGLEAKILRQAIDKQVIQAGDLKNIFAGKHSPEISRQIKRLIDKKMLRPETEGKRKYVIRFDNSYLLRGVIHALDKAGFLPVNLK